MNMEYRRILAAVSALALMMSVCSCGKKEESESTGTDGTVITEDSAAAKTGEKSSEKETKSGETTTKADSKSDKSTQTSKAGEKKADSTNAQNKEASAQSTTARNKDASVQSTTAANNGGNSDNNNNAPAPDNGGSAPQDQPGNEGSGEEVKEYTAEVMLGTVPVVNGSHVSVSGSSVTITEGGDYIFTGNVSDGQICVNTTTEEKVTVILNGVNISNSNGPAIFINEAKKCTIKSREGTVNFLSDGGKDKVNDGVIFSNDTVRLKGNGELNITANNAHGIASDDDIIIDNGTYNITSKKSGLFAHDDITINEGSLNIKGGTNGIKSKGTLNINGGNTVISGGTKEDKSSIYSESSFSYTGGSVYAAGNRVSVPTYAEAPYILLDLGETVSAGSSVEMLLNGRRMISFEPHNDFRCLLMLSPEAGDGSTFRANVNGNGKDFTVSGMENQFRMN